MRKILASSAAIIVGLSGAFAISQAAADNHLVPHSPEANQPGYWEDYFEERGYEDVSCYKDDREFDEYTVGAPDDDMYWVGIVLNAGSGDDANEVFFEPTEGDVLVHSSGKDISHVILCVGEVDDESPTPTPTPSMTPSVTPTVTVTPSVTPTVTVTPSVTPTVTVTPTATVTPSVTMSPTPSATVVPTTTVKPTVTVKPTPPRATTPWRRPAVNLPQTGD